MKAWVLGEFGDDAALLAAARALRERWGPRRAPRGASGSERDSGAGLRLDLHTPYPIHGAEEALGLRRSTVPIVALVAGVTGAVTGYLLQWYTVAYDWPINVGNRPPHSAPAFIPVTFELGVLFSALSIFLGLLFGYFRFPRVHHPVFEVEAFRSASIDRLWLSAEVDGAQAEAVATELRGLGARQVSIVGEALR